MAEDHNTQIIQGTYASFGRGDIQAVLNVLTDDIDWRLFGPPEIPYAGHFRNKDQVQEFFTALGGTVDFLQFEPREFIAKGDTVIVFGFEQGRVRATQRTFEAHWVHVFVMRDNKIAEFKEYTDTAAMVTAFRPA